MVDNGEHRTPGAHDSVTQKAPSDSMSEGERRFVKIFQKLSREERDLAGCLLLARNPCLMRPLEGRDY